MALVRYWLVIVLPVDSLQFWASMDNDVSYHGGC